MADLEAVCDLLDEEIGPGSWELVIRTKGMAASPPVRVEAGAAVARPASNSIPAHRTNPRKPASRRMATAGEGGDVLCRDCQSVRHPRKYRRCWDCRMRADGLDPDEYVVCSECGEAEHPQRYPRCYSCSANR